MLEGRLRRRLRVTGHETFDRYCDYLFKDGGLETESVFLIDAVTTNKTDFFREPRHFDYMASHVLPEFKAAGQRRIRAWSGQLQRRAASPAQRAATRRAHAHRRRWWARRERPAEVPSP